MRKLLRRLRGAVGVSLTWALGWGLIGALLGLVQLPGWVGFGRFGFLDFALVGLLSGGAFSVALDIVGLRRTLDEMSLPLFAGLGALATTLVFTIALRGGLLSDSRDNDRHPGASLRWLRRWFAGTGQNGRRPRVA